MVYDYRHELIELLNHTAKRPGKSAADPTQSYDHRRPA